MILRMLIFKKKKSPKKESDKVALLAKHWLYAKHWL